MPHKLIPAGLSRERKLVETAVIVNPMSGCGRTARIWPRIATGLDNKRTCFTDGPGHATALARELLHAGFGRIVAMGGDGTLNEIVNGFFEQDLPINPNASLAMIPVGTGCDFRRSLGIRDPEDAVAILHSGRPLPIDIGKIRFLDHSGAAQTKYFANVVSFGMGGEVAQWSKNAFRRLGSSAAFRYAILRAFLTCRPKNIELTLDRAGPARAHTITNIAIGNGRFHGGGMHICPRAHLDDGLLEVTVIDALGIWQLARDLKVLYSADLYEHPKAHHFRAAEVAARARERVMIEVDGEPLGTLPAEITLLPSAIRVWQRAQPSFREGTGPIA